MAGKYQLRKNAQYFWNLKAGNSEKILTSETYVNKQGALNGIDSCKRNSGTESNYVKHGSGTQWWFVPKAGNHETIGKSEMYVSAQGRDNGVRSCIENGPNGTLEDLT
ncbi:MAG: YegP family protein [Betaproteobacteria bacterium]|nr:YegP family protein [Betaproteobacteria bacterium]